MQLKCYEYEWCFDESTGRLTCKRHGLAWRDETGDGAVLALLMVASDMKYTIEGAKNLARCRRNAVGLCRRASTEHLLILPI